MEATLAPSFQNESVRFSVQRKPQSVVEFDVEALAPLVTKAKSRAIHAVSKQVSLPGFRKGKAPESLIMKNYPNDVLREWEQQVGDLSLHTCCPLAHIFPLDKETRVTYKMKNISEHGALLTLTFEVEPQVPDIDPKKLHVTPVSRPEVTEKTIQETIRQVQFFFAKWAPLERPIEAGDYVNLDVDVIRESESGVHYEPLFRQTRFEVSTERMAQWMYDLVLGKQLGDQLEGISTPDESASEEEKNLGSKKVRVTVVETLAATLPECDQAFAMQVGAASPEELLSNIEKLLHKQANAHVLEAEREQAIAFLLSEYPFDLPASLIDREVSFRAKQLSAEAEFVKHWEALEQSERQKTIATLREQSEKAVRLFYLCKKILQQGNLTVSPRDVPPAATSFLEACLDPVKFLSQRKNPDLDHAEAFSRLVLEKAQDYVLQNAMRS